MYTLYNTRTDRKAVHVIKLITFGVSVQTRVSMHCKCVESSSIEIGELYWNLPFFSSHAMPIGREREAYSFSEPSGS